MAHYDNSKRNKANPNPKAEVKWGDQTWEEMAYTGVNYSIDRLRGMTTAAGSQQRQFAIHVDGQADTHPASCLLLSVALATGLVAIEPETRARASTASGEWPTYGGDLANTKYSPLDQIKGENFSSLRIAWRAKSPDALLSVPIPGAGEWTGSPRDVFDELNRRDPERWRDGEPLVVANFKATPLMIGGVLYLNTPTSVGAALDARTGATLWNDNPKSYEAGTTTMTLRWNQRGVAYWTDGTAARVYWGTGDGYLVAVDAKTGRPVREFGQSGRVDLMEGLPRGKRGARDWLNSLAYSVQSPPTSCATR